MLSPIPISTVIAHRRRLARHAAPSVLLVATLAGPWLACRQGEVRALLPVARAITSSPTRVFELSAISDREVTAITDLTAIPPLADVNPPIYRREGPFPATALDELEIEVAAMTRGQLVASWQGQDEGGRPATGRLVRQAEHAEATPAGSRRFRFALVDDPAWRGTIEVLQVHTGARHRFAIRPVRANEIHRRPTAARLAEAAGAAWMVEVDADRRPSLLAAPGYPRPLPPPPPGAGVLALSLAVSAAMREPTTVRIVAGDPGSGERVLWEQVLRPGAVGWQEAKITLPRGLIEAPNIHVDGEAGTVVYVGDPTYLAAVDERRPNLLLVSIDTLRADHLPLYGYARATSPRLDAWARRAVVFRRTVASATTTLPSHASLFSGLDAIRHGVHHAPVPGALPLLAEHLRTAGWRTVARTGGGFLHPYYGLGRGFERFSFHRQGVDRGGELAQGMAIVQPWLDELADQPFFLFLHTYEVHGPYRPREGHTAAVAPGFAPPGLAWLLAERSSEETGYRVMRDGRYVFRGEDPNGPELGEASPQDAINLYDGSIRYVDAVIGELLDRLERLGIADRTVVVITSDHGEAFGEHGEGGHGYLHANNAMIPLVVLDPRRPGGHHEHRQVRSVDILPTVLELLGAPSLPNLDGVSLLPAMAGQPVPGLPQVASTYAANTGYGLSLRTDDHLALLLDNGLWPPFLGTRSLFDTATDPDEARDLARTDPRTEPLTDQLRALFERQAPGLHLRLRAIGGSSPARLALTHRELSPLRTKSVRFGGTAVWDGSLRLELPPESDTHLVLEVTPDVVGVISGAHQTRLDGAQGSLTLGDVEIDWRWRLIGPWPTGATEPRDDLLLAQLRALGYAN